MIYRLKRFAKLIINTVKQAHIWKFTTVQMYKLLGLVCIMIVLFVFFSGTLDGVIEVLIGFCLAKATSLVIDVISVSLEDRNKLKNEFNYDPNLYLQKVLIGGKELPIWYEPLYSAEHGIYSLDSTDCPEKEFEIDPFLQMHFSEIIEAHSHSYIKNMMMIRLDDCKVVANEKKVMLYTSRTAFYNDLATNRAMDFTFKNQITVRDIYEFRSTLTPLMESHMSNHIGINAILFVGNKMLLPRRAGSATMSKGQLTSSLAFGLTEADYTKMCQKTFGETINLILLNKLRDLYLKDLTEMYLQGSVHIYFLGLGRLINTGGKPQFYYAITAPKGSISYINPLAENRIDGYNKIFEVSGIEPETDGSFELTLFVDHRRRKTQKLHNKKAEISFFANYYHLVRTARCQPLVGIPEWVTRGAETV